MVAARLDPSDGAGLAVAVDSHHCLVVGVGAGTGLACVRRFVEGGYRVSMIARHRERLQSFAESNPNTFAYPADITEIDGYRATLRRIVAEQGHPKSVIYNAAMATFKPYTELDVADLDKGGFETYLRVCATCLARAHARTGDAASISGYVGKGKALAKALANFAVAYADQTESDHQALLEAIESGRITAETGI